MECCLAIEPLTPQRVASWTLTRPISKWGCVVWRGGESAERGGEGRGMGQHMLGRPMRGHPCWPPYVALITLFPPDLHVPLACLLVL